MAATSFQPHSLGLGFDHSTTKITKSRARDTVKPILKKLHSSHSEKNSLDLDRAWEDQTTPHVVYSLGHGSQHQHADLDHSDDASSYPAEVGAGAGPGPGPGAVGSRSARDVSFAFSASDRSAGGRATTLRSKSSTGPANSNSHSHPHSSSATHHNFSHNRTTSGASHISVATSGSGRNASFVHPRQQTPRTSTPPLHSYANSRVSLDTGNNIDEDDSDDSDDVTPSFQPTLPPSHSNSRRPSLNNVNRASSFTDISQPLRVATSRSTSTGATPRLVSSSFAANQGRSSEVHVGTPGSVTVVSESPISPTSTTPIGSSPQMVSSAMSSSTTAMSPLRNSLDMNGFRIRSRSEVDTATRQEQVRQARRKFEEKEKAKEEKYAREQVRKREKADHKEARAHATHTRKSSFGTSGLSSGRNSSSTDVRPTASRKNTSTSNSRYDISAEKTSTDDFLSRGYDSVATGREPEARADDVHFQSNRRSKAAKRKTNGAWTAFMLWLRTRLLRLGRR